jgi:2-amino-4-hydroxy-6-hydroxymethyldihydropteridine diphosphokinase
VATDKRTRAYVGLGSNQGDSPGTLRLAFERLADEGSAFVNSDLYITQPWGRTDQPEFFNAAAAFDTELDAARLIDRLHAIENEFGRVRAERWGPRTLDLDLLVFGDHVVDRPECKVPHPLLRERAFALEPLSEIAPDLRIPGDGRTVAEVLAALSPSDRATVRRLQGTARLVPPPRVDYDAPNGAGTGYDTLRPFSKFDRCVLEMVLEATGPLEGKRALDIGCGTGRFTRRIAEEGAIVTGFDASETMLRAARESPHQTARTIDYVRGDANHALPAGAYDVISAFYCVQYLAGDSWLRLARESLGPGGVLVIATFPHKHFAEIELARFFPSLPSIDMARFPSTPVLEHALASTGFEEVTARERLIEIEDETKAFIERVARKYLSSFYLLPDDEFAAGLQAMRTAWRDRQTIVRTARTVAVSGRRGRGQR